MVVVGVVGQHQVGPDLGQEPAQRLDQRPVSQKPAVGKAEEPRFDRQRRGRRPGLGGAPPGQPRPRRRPPRSPVGGNRHDQPRPRRGPGAQAAPGEDLEVVGMGADGEQPHARARNSSTIAAVQVKLPPPSGAPSVGS